MIDRNEKGLVDCIKYELDLSERVRWLAHNLIAHPLMTVLPLSYGNRLHNATIPKSIQSEKQR